MNLYEAIFLRQSVRQFSMTPVPPEVLSRIGTFYEQTAPLFPGIHTEIGITENTEGRHLLTGFFGIQAPYYLTFYSEIRDRAEMNAGYICEQLGISYPGFQKKLRNEGGSEFKPSEITVLTELLHLTREEVDEIFFAAEVGIMPTAEA